MLGHNDCTYLLGFAYLLFEEKVPDSVYAN